MADPALAVRVLSLSGPLLTRASVAQLAAELATAARGDAADDLRPLALDCAAIEGVTPDGLAALLELGARTAEAAPTRPLALTGLSRALTLTAIQAELPSRFAIYVDRDALARARDVSRESVCAP